MTKREKITMDRKYKNSTREVRVLCVDAGGDYPVVALDGRGNVLRFTSDGHFWGMKREFDLIPIPETRTVWVNVHDRGRGLVAAAFNSEKESREYVDSDTIAIAQPLTFEVNK